MKKCLVVIAHPLRNSLCQYIAEHTIEHLVGKGYTVSVKDLYQQGFNPTLNSTERESYYRDEFDSSDILEDINELKQTEFLVLIFPTWWFGFPAILKGWFDRVWAPTHAYNHASDLGAIQPCLDNLKQVYAITTLGSPWWVDVFVLWKPVYRTLKIALLGACTKKCRFQMLSLYKSENAPPDRVEKFLRKIRSKI
ncbi:NAD(P)H-dependent oxidoreductase [Vibrio viridaestus]|uniref:Flavodoxin family protein n=1 Tax=Vibrio viridaestus TaxID=2487322 RepID=A0A3N9U8X9_9VIBR|nr:NAD(P)H-dependent oxidoreductase [Vibrio viridaestus]RQW64676.1 flavodoxin family protein [Vibrio viridaestus]